MRIAHVRTAEVSRTDIAARRAWHVEYTARPMSDGSRRFAPWIWGLILAVIAYAPALVKHDKSGWGDWQQFHHWWEVGRVSILRWHELPLWDPHHCGGVPMWAM